MPVGAEWLPGDGIKAKGNAMRQSMKRMAIVALVWPGSLDAAIRAYR
jgi:hypothetical protein